MRIFFFLIFSVTVFTQPFLVYGATTHEEDVAPHLSQLHVVQSPEEVQNKEAAKALEAERKTLEKTWGIILALGPDEFEVFQAIMTEKSFDSADLKHRDLMTRLADLFAETQTEYQTVRLDVLKCFGPFVRVTHAGSTLGCFRVLLEFWANPDIVDQEKERLLTAATAKAETWTDATRVSALRSALTPVKLEGYPF